MNTGVEIEVLVIGGGVVGLATARALAEAGHEVLLVERHARFGTETTSRNSGVIHAGLYYPTDSRKARTCVAGRRALYAFAEAHGVAHQRTGKLVIATDPEEDEALEALAERAHANGVEELAWRSSAWLAEHEPSLRGIRALDVGVSGIIDAHGLVGALARSARDHGADLATSVPVTGLEAGPHGWSVRAGDETIRARLVVNAAGHGADRIAALAGIDPDARGWRLHPWKGSYFALAASAPKPRRPLVYPLPTRGGLGVHLTRDLAGQTLAGPDACLARGPDDLDVDPDRAAAFAASVQRYLPAIREEHLRPGYVGLRPKLRADGGFADFVLEEDPPQMVHLLGIESPGLTAALALADEVVTLVDARR
ncbi:MAG: NAD(P)/FAD-dependent oxidoreductase [Deltaproteobacteria bacterium]|nr:NAD(P)/FAD-dependent oxidoreductase [Deltaproteobacteria bacterium]